MKMLDESPTMEVAVQRWKEFHETLERRMLQHIDELSSSGFADKRWCAIARTDFEKAMLALDKALPKDMAGRREYGKVPMPDGASLPDPPPDPLADRYSPEKLKLRNLRDDPLG